MTRHDTIIAGRGARKHAVRVERPRKRKFVAGWTRLQVHRRGLAAVADEFGLAGMLDLGGIMTGDRMRGLLGRKRASELVAKIDMAPAAPIRVPAPGLLADDVSRNIYPDRQRQFGADLIGGVL